MDLRRFLKDERRRREVAVGSAAQAAQWRLIQSVAAENVCSML